MWLGCALLFVGCESQQVDLVDGGVGRKLVILDPPGSQIGLRYGTSIDLPVRYVQDDAKQTPLPNATVRFAIFDDPAGSTLSRDVVTTDDQGLATVTLTAGMAEGSFRVQVTAGGADAVQFAVSTSKLQFVELDAQLADPLPGAGARTLTAALHTDHACDALPVTPSDTSAARSLSRDAASSATLAFVNLLSRTYAITGRVVDGGKVVAYGCLDVDVALAPPGARLLVPIAMSRVEPSVAGTFSLTTSVGTSRAARSDGLFADYDVLDRCSGHLAQIFLDELVARIAPDRATALAALRGATSASTSGASTVQCRDASVGADASLDVTIDALFEANGAPGVERASLVGDLDGVLAGTTLLSTLTLSPTVASPGDDATAPRRLLADHRQDSVTITLGSITEDVDLAGLGYPILDVSGIAVAYAQDTIAIGTHALPLALPTLWGSAWETLGIAARLPAVTPATASGWVAATVDAASYESATGCDAIEALVCGVTDPTGCVGSIVGPCMDATIAVGARLDGVFTRQPDLVLSGLAMAVDSDGDLVADRLMPASWQASGTLLAALAFSGQRSTP